MRRPHSLRVLDVVCAVTFLFSALILWISNHSPLSLNIRIFRASVVLMTIIIVISDVFLSLSWVLRKIFVSHSVNPLITVDSNQGRQFDERDETTEIISESTTSKPLGTEKRQIFDTPYVSSCNAYPRKPIVIDIGRSTVRYGIAHFERPMGVHSLGRSHGRGNFDQSTVSGMSDFALQSPYMRDGSSIDWDTMESIWRRIYEGSSHLTRDIVEAHRP